MAYLRLSGTLMALMILTGCFGSPAGYETARATARAWGDTLPTASTKDTRQTKVEIAKNRLAYQVVCRETGLCRDGAQ